MSAVSALLPVLPQAYVRRLMNCLETRVDVEDDGDPPFSLTWPMVHEMRRIAGVPANWLTGRLLRLHQRDLDLHLWTVLSFEMWCRRFLDMPIESPKAAA